jgi:hypothetical protein
MEKEYLDNLLIGGNEMILPGEELHYTQHLTVRFELDCFPALFLEWLMNAHRTVAFQSLRGMYIGIE